MSNISSISWTDATWNFVLGCTKVSSECDRCYAMREVHRMAGNPHPSVAAACAGLTQIVNGRPAWTNEVRVVLERTFWPYRWKAPKRIFVNSLSDLYHHDVPEGAIASGFAVMANCPQHLFQILTKRPERQNALLSDRRFARRVLEEARGAGAHFKGCDRWPLPNVCAGFSAGNQALFNERWADFRGTPASMLMASLEPLLGPILLPADFLALGKQAVVVVGGESGKGSRPMHPDWVRAIRDQCKVAGVLFHLKQWGDWWPISNVEADSDQERAMRSKLRFDDCLHLWPRGGSVRIGKELAGRTLDGEEHNDMHSMP